MTSLNNHSPRENHGSALVVTILLVSVMLTAALILLQRIIPYAKNVRGMNDAMQSYYTARGEVEAARLGFFYIGNGAVQAWRLPTIFGLLSDADLPTSYTATPGRALVTTAIRDEEDPVKTKDFTMTVPGNTILTYEVEYQFPKLDRATRLHRDHIVIAQNRDIPLTIRLFPTDASPKQFGTSQRHPGYHTLSSKKGGGLRFDLRGVNTADGNFGLALRFFPGYSPTEYAILTVKIQYTAGATIKTFTVEYDKDSSYTGQEFNLYTNVKLGVIQEIDTSGSVIIGTAQTFKEFLNSNKCNVGGTTSCSLTFTLGNKNGLSEPSADFQLVSNIGTPVSIPDLNAVVIGDGLSENGLYFQRIVDLIPTRQDI